MISDWRGLLLSRSISGTFTFTKNTQDDAILSRLLRRRVASLLKMQNRSILLVRPHSLHIYGPRLGAKAAFSAKCQEADWKNGHKKGCEFQRICNEFNEKAKREQPSNERPPDGYCTGCNLEFNDEDDDCDLFCEACGYQACESCSAHHSKGTNFFY